MMDRAQIAEIIPHRPPMLLVDRVSALVPGREIVAHKLVTGAEVWPGAVAFPPVLIIESFAQAALVLLMADKPNPDVVTGQVPVAGVVERAVFGAPVQVGDEIEHRITLVRRYGGMAVVKGTSLVGGEPVLTVGRVVAALSTTDVLRRTPA